MRLGVKRCAKGAKRGTLKQDHQQNGFDGNVARWLVFLALVSVVWMTGCASSRSKSATAQRGETAAAATNIDKGNPEALAHWAAGVSYELSENDDKALDEFDKSAASDPGHEALVLELAQRHLRNHQADKAIALLTESAKRPEASADILSWLARAYLQTGNTNAALAEGRKAVERDPKSLDAYESLLEGYLGTGQTGEASKLLMRASGSVDRDPRSLTAVADFYATYLRSAPKDTKSQARAVALLDGAAGMKFSSARLWQHTADLYERLGESKKAAAIYERLLSDAADTSSEKQGFRQQLAQIYLEADDKTNALRQLQAIVRDDPTRFPNAWFALGEIAEQNEKFADAVDDFQNAIRAKPELEPAYYDLSLAQANLHETADALKTLETARARFNNPFRYEFYSALVQREAKNYPEAIRHLTAAETVAKATAPDLLDKAFYFELGAAYERNHQFAEADQYLQKAIDLDPSFAEAMNYLGYMLADRGEQLGRARNLIERAIQIDPKNSAFLDSMGWTFYKLKQPDQALPWMLKAVASSPEPDATVLDHLGDVYLSLRQVDKALDTWRKSLSIEPSEDVKKKIDVNSRS
jgi:tetratricopeptide (TPR) repeat protein